MSSTLNRRRRDEKRTLQRVEDRAVTRAAIPGAASLGASSDATAIISPAINSTNYADADGRSVRGAMTELDTTENSRRVTFTDAN